jgi:drug/metabolite transporter (DMT)-like permease
LAFKLVRTDFSKRSIRDVLAVALCYGGFIGLQAIGLNYATSVEGGIVFAIIPIITMLMAAGLLKERTTTLQKLFVSLSVTGVILMFIMSAGVIDGMNFIGLVILLLSSISLALSNVLMRKLRKVFTPTEISLTIVLTCCLVFNVISIGSELYQGTLDEYFAPLGNSSFLISVIYLGVTCTFLTSLMMSYMLAHMEAVEATLFGNVSTAISIVAGVLIIGEPLQPYHVLCTLLIITGVAGTSLSGKKNSSIAKRS